ncbi:DMT family transporter [Streptosporangium sp. NPDC004379]|uniref:DMT family transporter n=1 Tax=Streptosporangium sp. NPDC004379 TaxID=3366189 RepID=UPI0036A3357B
MPVIAVVLALCAAACNAAASVLQRQAARALPENGVSGLALAWRLVRTPVWLGGIGALIGGFLFQASALDNGGLTLVQPLLITELPFTIALAAKVFDMRPDLGTWLAIGSLTGGLALLLAAAAPSPGLRYPDPADWLVTVVATVLTTGALLAAARVSRGRLRAALLGTASALGFAFTATLMKESTHVFSREGAGVLTTWPPYAMAGAGLVSVVLLQQALRSGTLVVVQPALSVVDPVISIVYGVALFDEAIRLGPWVVAELAGLGLILYGTVRLARSRFIQG